VVVLGTSAVVLVLVVPWVGVLVVVEGLEVDSEVVGLVGLAVVMVVVLVVFAVVTVVVLVVFSVVMVVVDVVFFCGDGCG